MAWRSTCTVGPHSTIVLRPPSQPAGQSEIYFRATRSRLDEGDPRHHLANARAKVGATTTAQLVWILTPRLPEPQDRVDAD